MNSADAKSSPFLPEIDRRDLDPSTVSRAIEQFGALIVRNCLPLGLVRELDDYVQEALAEMAAPSNQRNPSVLRDFDDTPQLRSARAFAGGDGCALLVDCPSVFRRTLEIYKENGLLSFVAAYLEGVPVLSRFKATLRRTRPHQVATERWHQDGAFMGADMRTLNIWMALTECGERAASVEVATKRFSGVIPCDFGPTLSAQKADSLSPLPVTPVCAPGDAILFDQFCLHRTSRHLDYSEERRALEMWFFEPTTYPHAYDPVPVALEQA